MKTMTVFEARNNFSRTLDAAKEDVVVVTRNGKPVAAIHAIGDDDLEDMLLERSERFWDMIARARRGRAVSLVRAAAALGVARGGRKRGRRRKPRGRAATRRAVPAGARGG
jgi:prevent-host-death family protein